MGLKKIKLALQGGALRSIAHVGAIEAFEEEGIEIQEIAASSAASMVGLAYKLGYSLAEMKHMTIEGDYTKFAGRAANLFRKMNNRSLFSPRGAFELGTTYSSAFWNIIRTKGVDSGKVMHEWTSRLLEGKNYKADATFGDLPDGRDIKIAVFDYVYEKILVFSKETTPNESIALAVRAATALAPIFSPLPWTDAKGRQHLLMDSGVTMSYPLEVLLDRRGGSRFNRSVIGIRLRGARKRKNSIKPNVLEFYGGLLSANSEVQAKVYDLDPDIRKRTINVNVGRILVTDFLTIGNDKEKKTWLISQGYKAVKNYLKKRNRIFSLSR